MTRIRRIIALLLALVLCLALFVGCTKPDPGEDPGDDPGVIDPNEPDDPGDPGVTTDPVPADDAIHVSSVEELLEAIEPGAEIVIEPGDYDLGKTLAKIWNLDGVNYNLTHAYVTVAEVGDGCELHIIGCDDLTIRGGSDNRLDTNLLTDPRTATVLTFFNCNNLTVQEITAGHTMMGSCSGDVIFVENCRNVVFRDVDLFGCGVCGLRANETDGLLVEDSRIHDCEAAPFWFYECTGNFDFVGCSLDDNMGGGSLEGSEYPVLTFKDCFFGEHETNEWSYSPFATFDNCEFSEVNYWLGPEGEKFEPDELRHCQFDAGVLAETLWEGFLMLNDKTGQATCLPMWIRYEETNVTLEFLGDGTGHLYWVDGTSSTFTWAMEDFYTAVFSDDANSYLGRVGLYAKDPVGEGDAAYYLHLQLGDEVVWLHEYESYLW